MSHDKKNEIKKIGLISLLFVTISNMLGSGIFLVPSTLAQYGSVTLISWVITLIGVLGLAFVFSRLAILQPNDNGIIGDAGVQYGRYSEFLLSLSYWLTAWIGNVALIITAVSYMSYFFPSLTHPFAAAITGIILLWFFNYLATFGASFTTKLQSVTTVILIVMVLLVFIFGVTHPADGRCQASCRLTFPARH